MDHGSASIFIPILAIIFGCTIPIVAVVVEYFTKKSKLRIIDRAIEKGLPLEGLSLEEPRIPYRSGMVFLAVGLGIGIFAGLSGKMPELGVISIPALIGVAATLALIGVALIINDRINYDRLFNKESDPQ